MTAVILLGYWFLPAKTWWERQLQLLEKGKLRQAFQTTHTDSIANRCAKAKNENYELLTLFSASHTYNELESYSRNRLVFSTGFPRGFWVLLLARRNIAVFADCQRQIRSYFRSCAVNEVSHETLGDRKEVQSPSQSWTRWVSDATPRKIFE